MKPGVSLCFLLLLTLANSEALQLFSVSSSTTQVVPPSGSVSGGTIIYIKGLGFSLTPSQNSVDVGPYPCIIEADGLTETTLSCTTSDTGQQINQYYLPITVISNGAKQSLTNQQGSFSYLNSATPIIYNIFPSTSVPGAYVRFYGLHRITNLGDGRDLGDVISMKIGGTQCGRFDIVEGPISADSLATISCNQATLQEAGKYYPQEHVTKGLSTLSYFMRRTSFLNEKYYYAVLPGVSSVSPNSGTYSGNTLTITGRGFSTAKSSIAVEVNGTICDVTSSTLTQVVCQLRQKQLSDHAILQTNSGSQVKGYQAGSGLRYKRYDINALSTKTPDGLRTAIASSSTQITLQEEGYRGQIQTGNYYGTYYGQVFSGYFNAPVDGIYTFSGVADDSFAVYLSSSTYGSAESGTKLIYSDSVQDDNFFIRYRTTAEANVTLVQGRSYYIEVYHINIAGSGWLRVAASVPNTDTSLEWQTHTVHKMELAFTNDPQIVQFTQTGGTAGQINLTLLTRIIGKPPTTQAAVIDYNANISSFLNALNSFSTFSGYDISGTRAIYDSNDLVTTVEADAVKYVWTVSVRKLRATAATSATFTPKYLNYAGSQSFTQTILHPHGNLIGGTFGLSLGGNTISTSLSASASSSTIQNAFRTLPGFDNVAVDLITSSSQQAYGATWIITYYGVNQAIPDLTIDDFSLTGGLSGTKPTMASSTLRYYSPNLLFDPIDYNLLSMDSNQPSVRVTVNSMPSVCIGSCSYSYLFDTPVLSSARLSGTTVTLSLTDPANLGYTLADVTATIGGQPCTIVDVNAPIDPFQCQLPANADLTPQIVTGSYMPIVTVEPVGKVAELPAVTPFDFPLTLTSLSITSGTDNGGYLMILTGTGFPLTTSSATVTICGVSATLTAISNTQATVIVPQCTAGTQSVIISSSTQTSNSLPYTYTTGPPPGQIYTVSPQSHNPTMKGIMEITGYGFGVDKTAIRVDLANGSGKVYPMRVLNLDDGYIRVGIPGGLAGVYDVQVNLIGVGELLPADKTITTFTYELVLTGLNTNTGSYYGGTLLHLTGLNFAPALDQTLIYIGNQLNWFCTIQTLTTTEATCRAPPASQYYNISQAQTIYMQSRLMAVNTCSSPSACLFYYMNQTNSPSLTGISTDTITTGTITLSGNLLSSSIPEVILTNKETGKVTIVQVDSYTSDRIVFTVPAVEAGQYNVKTRVDPIGETNGYLLTVQSRISSTVPASISTEGGIVTLNGNGLPDGWPNSNYVLLIQSNNKFVQPQVLGSSPTAMSILLPASTSSFTISLTNPQDNILTSTVAVQAVTTPVLTLTSSSATAPGLNTLTFTKSNLLTADPAYLEIYSKYSSAEIYNLTISGSGASTIQVSQMLPAGSFGFRFYYISYGYATCTDTINIVFGQFSLPSQVASFNGGSFTLNVNDLSPSATLNFGGFKTQLSAVSLTSATAIIPAMVSPLSQSQYTLVTPTKLTSEQFTPISDTPSLSSLAFDHFHGTIYSSANPTCYIGVDAGSELRLELTRIRYFPNSEWMVVADYLLGATFEASEDGVAYTTIGTVGSTVHSGWNIIPFTLNTKYRYVRMAHTSTSKCQLAELELTGILHSATTVSSLTSHFTSVTYEDGANTFTFTDAVQYREDHTPVVNSLSQVNGDVFGGYNLTLTGNYLNFDTPTITIDGISCAVQMSASTSIICQVGSRLTLPSANSFSVQVGTMNAVTHATFSYVLRWSDIRTWGTDMPPIDGDLVYVPAGMNLLVDESTPKLQGILVQNGTLSFADETDMIIQAGFITLVGGQFKAGSQANPYQHKLTFIMSGGYYGAQQPIFGNKGIGCLECHFSMYGQPRLLTWTQLASTVNPGDTTLTIQDTVDWQVGQQIVIASTSFDHNEAEQKTITAISGTTITIDSPFVYKHYAGVQSYTGTDQLQMRAEVGLLTRNIKMMGDQTSVSQSYGSHLMMAGSAQNGLVGHIAYSEFTHCGQPRIIGRYCIHFHMNGDVTESYAIGNAVHHSMARVITLHGVHFLKVKDNVGYSVSGHNYFIEDGIETNNYLTHNLAISSLQAFTMLQTDISVASFWVTHPSNHFTYNHAAGSDFYGFWYQIKPHPDGPSATGDVCPMGNALGQVHHNVAHSNIRFGLRIFKLCPRKYPCRSIYQKDENDPWALNPGVIGTFHHFTLYKNGECGLLAEETGNLIFSDIISAENKRAGVQFYISQYTKTPVQISNSVIVGMTLTNGQSQSSKGIITPRVGNIRIDNIRFYHFGSNTHSLQTCSHCNDPMLFSNTVQQVYISSITYTNISGYKLFMNGQKKDILYDLDGSFTTNAFDGRQRVSGAVTYNWKHLASESACSSTTSVAAWDNTLICDQSVKVVGIAISSLTTSIFDGVGMKVQQIPDVYYNLSQTTTDYTETYSIFSISSGMDSKHNKKTYALPYITGRMYNLWWLTGLDFTSFKLVSSDYFKDTDDAVLFRFNYTLHREAFDIGIDTPNNPINWSQLLYPTAYILDSHNCTNGQYYHDDTIGKRTLQLCASAKNKNYFETALVKAISCRYLCPAPPGTFIKEDFVRYWSNVSQWPQGRLPLPGEDVYVNGNWTIIMDIDPAPANLMEIDGDVIIEDKENRYVSCNYLWVKAGSISAGSTSQPFQHELIFTLNGLKNDSGYTFDAGLQGSKIFVITGKVSLYGKAPRTTSTRLAQTALAGQSQIVVLSNTDWAVGDTLTLAPSFRNYQQFESVTITAISGTTISISPALSYTHYGSSTTTISNSVGQLDTRTVVGHTTRSIKIVPGADSGWGYHIWVYQMWQNTVSYTGVAIFDSVEFTLGGQYDTHNAALNLYNNMDPSSGETIVNNCAFTQCRSFCLYAYGHSSASITNNVFYDGSLFHIKMYHVQNFIVKNNVMIAAVKRPTYGGKQATACLELLNTAPISTNIQIENNVCQGSAVNGFALPFLTCSQVSSNPFVNNTVGSAASSGFILDRGITSDSCLAFSGVKAYGCRIGQIASPPGTTSLTYSNYILADNALGISLRFGLAGSDRTATFTDSFITAISRPDCAQCYTSGCSQMQAIRMLAVTVNGESYPRSFGPDFDVICKEEVLDAKAYLTNVIFENYRTSYVQSALASCSNNYIFRPHPNAPDLVGSTYLWNSPCNNCDFDSLARFDAPLSSQLGWFGGCGTILCTGRNNYFIQDYTGDTFGQTGVLLANNSWIGDNTAECTFNSIINGHLCSIHEFAVLEYESIAPDYNTRIMWPVSLKYDGGSWQTLTNGYKQWQWSGNEPLNKRLGRFISTIRMFQHYNMSFASNPPDDMRLQLQKRTAGGNNSDWIVVRIYYPFPNMVEVQVGGTVIRPISLLDNSSQNAVDVTSCGSNKFFYYNRTIQFVVTGEANCMVRVSLTNSVQLTLHFAMNISDFYQANGQTRLIDRMCALFQISDQSRVKIVSIYTGSTSVTLMINSPVTPQNQSYTANNAVGLAQAKTMQQDIDNTISNGTLASELALDSLTPLISASTTLIPMHPQETTEDDDSNRTKIVLGVSIAVGLTILLAIILVIWLKRRQSNKIVDSEDSSIAPSMSQNVIKQQKSNGSSPDKHLKVEIENLTEENISQYS